MTHNGLVSMPSAEYHAADGCNHSFLVEMDKTSPEHAMHRKLSSESTSSMKFGSAFHDRVLLPEYFNEHWVEKDICCGITDKNVQCKKVGQVRVDGLWFCGLHAPPAEPIDDVESLSIAEFELIDNMYKRLLNHPKARAFLGYQNGSQDDKAKYEQSFFWTDEETGILCKGRADLLSGLGPIIVDLKTTGKSATEDEFVKHVINYGYDLEAAHFIEGIRNIGYYDQEPRFVIVAIETKAPHGVACYELDADFLEARRAFERLGALKRQYAECLESGDWKSYPERVKKLTCPRWANLGG